MPQATSSLIEPASSRLLDELGPEWTPMVPPAPPQLFDSFSALALARSGARVALLCETIPGRRVPPSKGRREWRRQLERAYGRDAVIVFTDAAHSSFVWSWRDSSAPLLDRIVECRAPPREGLLRHARSNGFGEFNRGPALEAAVDLQVLRAVAELLPATDAVPPENLPELIDRIRCLDRPDEVRHFWRGLIRLPVIDLRCGDGEWLVNAAATLEPAYLACLDRIRNLVDDAGAERTTRRPEHLRDLKSIAELSEGSFGNGDPHLFARRLLVQRNLYGADSRQAQVRGCRAKLADFAGLPTDGRAFLDINMRTWPAVLSRVTNAGGPVTPSSTSAAIDRCPASISAVATAARGAVRFSRDLGKPGAELRVSVDLAEEIAVVGRAFEILRQHRLTVDDSGVALRRACHRVEGRRRALASRAEADAEFGDGAERVRIPALSLVFPWCTEWSGRPLLRGAIGH